MKNKIKIFFGVVYFVCGGLGSFNVYAHPTPASQHQQVNTSKSTPASQHQQVNTSKSGSFGCDCTALKACHYADCGPWCGFCADDSAQKCATCLCRSGGMAHCTNWPEILNDPNCKDLRDNYCNTQDGDGPAVCQNDPACG